MDVFIGIAQTYDDNVHPDSGRCLVHVEMMCGHKTRKHHCGSLAPSENEPWNLSVAIC